MGTEVLRPQNLLVDRVINSPAVFQRRRNGHRKPPSRPDQRRRFGSDELKTAKTVSGEMGMVKVTILRRGESLNSKIKREKFKSTLKNDGEFAAQKPAEMADVDIYAGSATSVVSPAPSSLPFPSFSRKKKSQVVPVDDSATRDLRRLLGLEL